MTTKTQAPEGGPADFAEYWHARWEETDALRDEYLRTKVQDIAREAFEAGAALAAHPVTVKQDLTVAAPAEGDGMLKPLIYAAMMHNGKPKTVAEFERAAATVADMLERRAIAQPLPEALPHPGSPEADKMLDALLAEYGQPVNMKNAARAGYMAARRLLQHARQPLPATDDAEPNVQPKGTPAAVPMCSEQAVLHALTMARSETHQQGDAALWQAFGRAMWRQFNAMLPAAPSPAPGDEPSQAEVDLTEALRERDAADDYIDALLDEVLGKDRHEWTSNYGHADAMDEVRGRIASQQSSLDFYKRRCDALQACQSTMRDPERTMVCDILANGSLLMNGLGQLAVERYAVPCAAVVADHTAVMRQALDAMLPAMGAWAGTCAWHGPLRKAIDAMHEALGDSQPQAVADTMPVLRKLVEQIDKAEFVDENGHPIKMNVAYLAAKELL